jgi:hypothetical protein
LNTAEKADSHLNACKNHYQRLKPINPILNEINGIMATTRSWRVNEISI